MEEDSYTGSAPVEPMTQKKHAAMIERLSARHSQPAAAVRRSQPGTSSLQSFLDRFSDSKRSIESEIEQCRAKIGGPDAGPHLKPDLDRISASIADLEQLLAESSYLLPPYEVRTALKAVSDLKEALEKASSELLPRRKFSFRNKQAAAKKEPSGFVQKAEEAKAPEAIPAEKSNLPVVRNSPGFRSREGVTLVKDFRGSDEREGEFSLTDLSSCEVYLRGQFRALFVYRLRNCRVFVGPVFGSVLIEDVEGCMFMLASHQIRIHHARATDFYLRVRSRPIIEDCSGVRFAPYRLLYKGVEEDLGASGLREETGNWANVDDFRWLKAMQSPNWCVLPEEECEAIVDISHFDETR